MTRAWFRLITHSQAWGTIMSSEDAGFTRGGEMCGGVGGGEHMLTHLTGLLRALSMCMSHTDPASRPPPAIPQITISSNVNHTLHQSLGESNVDHTLHQSLGESNVDHTLHQSLADV